tara:strand:+ start:769 stop:1368 length:600 start_codon:yes stop_codon:yes gene_type:complete
MSASQSSSPYVVKIQKDLDDDFERLKREDLTPWAFFNAGNALVLTNRRGIRVSYEGVEFEGSPQTVFWGHFHLPVLEDVIRDHFERILVLCIEGRFYNGQALEEVSEHLQARVSRYLDDMAEIDRRIRGKGFPNNVDLRPVVREKSHMDDTIKRHLDETLMRLQAAKPPWFQRNQWWLQTVLSVAAGGLAGAAGGALFK